MSPHDRSGPKNKGTRFTGDRYVSSSEDHTSISSESLQGALEELGDLKKDIDTSIDIDSQLYVSDQDLKGICPQCYGSDYISSVGTLHIAGSPREVLRCDQCNRLFSKMQGGIRQLVEKVKEITGTEDVTFTAKSKRSNTSNDVSEIDIDDDTKHKLDQLKMELTNVSCAVSNLVDEIKDLIWQNRQAMEEQKGDPMIGLRKSIFDFNLE